MSREDRDDLLFRAAFALDTGTSFASKDNEIPSPAWRGLPGAPSTDGKNAIQINVIAVDNL